MVDATLAALADMTDDLYEPQGCQEHSLPAVEETMACSLYGFFLTCAEQTAGDKGYVSAQWLAQHGGMLCLENRRGVMVAPARAASWCPPGWLFVDQAKATTPLVLAALEQVKSASRSL